MSQDPREHLNKLITHFDTAMLVTRTSDGSLRSRPMMIAERRGEGELWFATGLDTAKAGEIEQDPRVNLVLQKVDACISISGEADVVRDRETIEGLWKETWKPWFPKGRSDPNLGLVRVRVRSAEYWDFEGTKGIRFLLKAAVAYVGGTTPDTTPQMHAKVNA